MEYINPSRVLLIVNSSISQSLLDAQDYVTRRGLNPNHILSFNFGQYIPFLTRNQLYNTSVYTCQTSGPYQGLSFMDAITNYRKDNPIDAIILSTYTPISVYVENIGEPGGVFWIRPLPVWAASSFGIAYFGPDVYRTSYATGHAATGWWTPYVTVDIFSGEYPGTGNRTHDTPERIIEFVEHNWKPTLGDPDYAVTATYVSSYFDQPTDRTYYIFDFGLGVTPPQFGNLAPFKGPGITPYTVVRGGPNQYVIPDTLPALPSNQAYYLLDDRIESLSFTPFTGTLSGTYTFWPLNPKNIQCQIPHGRLGCYDGIGSDRYNLGNFEQYKWDATQGTPNRPLAEAPLRPVTPGMTWDSKKGQSVAIDDLICVDNGHKGTFYYYKVTTAGTLHSTVWPTHGSGTETNGGASLQFLYIESVYRNAVTKALIAEQQSQLDSVHVLSQTHSYLNSIEVNKVSFKWAKQMGMQNVYRVALPGSTGISPPWPSNLGRATTLEVVGTQQPGFTGYAQLGAGISASQTSIQVGNVDTMAPAGVVQISGRPVAKLTAPLNVGDTTCQIDRIEGFVTAPGYKTINYWIRTLPSYTLQEYTLQYSSITGSSSPYTINLTSPVPQSMPTGAVIFSGYTCKENISYSSIDTSTNPPTLVGCVRAKDDPSLRSPQYYTFQGPTQLGSPSSWTAPYSYAFESGSTITPLSPKMKRKDTYYFFPGGMSCYDPGLPPFFALVIETPFNKAPTIYDDLNGKVATGAWGYIWTSFAGIFAEGMLRNGGSAAISTYTEPYSSGIGPVSDVFVYTSYYKMPVMQGLFYTTGAHPALTAFGDPLYAPYKSTPTTQLNVSLNPYGM